MKEVIVNGSIKGIVSKNPNLTGYRYAMRRIQGQIRSIEPEVIVGFAGYFYTEKELVFPKRTRINSDNTVAIKDLLNVDKIEEVKSGSTEKEETGQGTDHQDQTATQ